MDTLIGRRLGKYQLETLVGRGGMATVYRAHDTVLNRSVAIKVLEPALTFDPKSVERFRREAVTAANLEHPNIVRVYDVQQEGKIHFIAMRFVQGTTLRDILRDNGPLPLEAILNIIVPVASALHYAHRHGVIHRDVKPGNILVEPDGNVLLTDFGIARAAGGTQAGLTATGLVMGTADYLAPEQIAGRPAEPRSDIYSLGVVLYEMLTGVTPFAGENTASILYRQVHDQPPPLRSLNTRLPSELQPLMDRALAKNPALRHADALDLARDLETLAQWLPQGSPWLNRNASPPPYTYTPQPSRNGSGPRSSGPVGVHTGVSVRPPEGVPGSGAQAVPRVYYEGAYEVPAPDPYPTGVRPILAPPQAQGGRGRGVFLLLMAVLLLVVGVVAIVMATGVLSRGGGNGGDARFLAPGPPTYTGQTRQHESMSIPRALIAPQVDGDISDWKSAPAGPFPAPHNTFTAKNVEPYDGPADLSANFYFAWDAANFYVAADITDDVHVQFAGTRGYNLFKGDDIEIWFDTDLAGDFASREANADDYQLGLSPGDFAGLAPEAVFWNPDRKDTRNRLVTVAARPKEGGGYTLEAAVPWEALGGFTPETGTAMGFAVSAGDNDQRNVPIQEIMLTTVPALEYRKPFTFGNLFF
jgi:serine/threonine protein kinase